MAIVDMTKFNLISFDDKRQALLDELQRFEYVHFSDTSDLREEKDLENVELPLPIRENEEELSQVKWLISLPLQYYSIITNNQIIYPN